MNDSVDDAQQRVAARFDVRLRAVLLRRAARRQWVGSLSTVVGIALLAFIHWGGPGQGLVPYFVVLRLLILAYNQWIARRILSLAAQPEKVVALKGEFIFGMAAAGACWGMVGWMMPNMDMVGWSARDIFSFVTLVYISAVALITAGHAPRAFVAHITAQWLVVLTPLVASNEMRSENLLIVLVVLGMMLTTLLFAQMLLLQTRRGVEAELQRADLTESLRTVNRELALALERAVETASRDPLTGVLNRRAMHGCADYVEAARRRHTQPCSLLLLDLDFFKRINDSYGHAAGDAVLVEAAETLRLALREVDLIARWGGEEFLVLMPECDADSALIRAEELRAAIERMVVPALPTGRAISVSIGAADWPAGTSFVQAVDRADAALYCAKDAGRNRVMLAA